VTQDQEIFPYYRSPASIRDQQFKQRMRGLDEAEVYEYLDLLADQVHTSERERAELRAEIERLQDASRHGEREETPAVNPQAVILFSQAQQVADQLVEEAVRHARDLMISARNQQREIMQRAHEAASATVRESAATRADGTVTGYTTPVPEIEYVRTFARVAQIQLRSVLDALTEQVDKLGDTPKLGPAPAHGQHLDVEQLSIEPWRDIGSTVGG
jgi:cell division initiation protein